MIIIIAANLRIDHKIILQYCVVRPTKDEVKLRIVYNTTNAGVKSKPVLVLTREIAG